MTFATGCESSVILYIGKESNSPFSNELKSHSKSVDVIYEQSGAEALELLQGRQLHLQEIWIQSDAPAPGLLVLVSQARKYYPALPIRLIETSPEDCFPDSENQRLTLSQRLLPEGIARQIDILSKTSEIISRLKLLMKTNEIAATLGSPGAASTIHSEESGESQEIMQAGYIAVPLSEFAHQEIVHFDVYVRLPSKRFLHLLAAGESFAIERLISYAERGVKELYIRRESHEKSIAYADLLAKTLLTRENIPQLIKLNHQLSHGETLLEKIRKNGIDDNHFEYAQFYVRGVQKTMKHLLAQNPLPQTFFRSFAGYEHAVSCSVAASILALRLFPKSDPKQEHEWIGLAAYLHDIGHSQLDSAHSIIAMNYSELDPYHLENLAQFTPEERSLIESHPQLGADILSRLPGVPPQVIDAVRNHHERRDLSGYPRKIPANQISMVTEIVALSDELIRALAQHRLDPDFQWQHHLESKVLPSFSFAVSKEFKDFFLTKTNSI